MSPPAVSPPRPRLASPTPHPVLLPSIASPGLASPTMATGGSGGPASPASPTAVVDLPSPGQLAQILAPQARLKPYPNLT